MLTSLVPFVYLGALAPERLEIDVGQYDPTDPDPSTALSATLTIQLPDGEEVSGVAATVPATAASALSSNTAPFALADGMILNVSFNGGSPVSVTFHAGSFVDITHATAAEVVAVLAAAFLAASVPATAAVAGSAVRISTTTNGQTSSLTFTTGSALAVLGFSGTSSGAGTPVPGSLSLVHAWTSTDLPMLGEYTVFASLTLPGGVYRTAPRPFRCVSQFDTQGPARGPCKVSTVLA